MESLDELKAHLTQYLDTRIKTAIDEGNADLMKDLGPKFQSIEDNVAQVSKDVASVSDSVAGVINAALAPISTVLNGINAIVGRIPFVG